MPQPPQSSNRRGPVFRLLLRATDPGAAGGLTIELGGIRWTLVAYEQVPVPAEAPAYTCISYSWGRGKTADPFDAGQSISDRAFAVVEAAIKSLQPPAIWIDAFCVPAEGAARAQCLQSLGAIYGAATQVAVVLSKACAASLEQIRASCRMDPAELLVFENDEWVTRAWTYQEIANSRVTQFIAEGGGGPVDGQQLLNSLGQAISDLKRGAGVDAFEFQKRYSNVSDLEDTLADYMISSYLQRSAYQVVAAMNRRYTERADDHFDAMIAALTATPPELARDPTLPPAERFMRVCEAKGDYSFIYCVGERSTVPGRGWRPVAGDILAVLSWHTWGQGQSGELFPTHLRLDNLCRMVPGVLNADATKLLRWWLEAGGFSVPAGDLADAILKRLQRIGFSGCGAHLEMETGYFFPQTAPPNDMESRVMVPAGVRWVHGGPGLLVTRNGADMHHFRDVGVFVGRVPKTGESASVA